MKSITINDAITGQKLIRVWKTKKGYYLEALNTTTPFDCYIKTNDNDKICIPFRKK